MAAVGEDGIGVGEEQQPADLEVAETDEQRRRAVERSRARSEELRDKTIGLAAAVAETEEMVADTLEASARVRPHAAERLNEAAREARRYAVYEREEARRRTAEQAEDRAAEEPPA